MRKFVALCAVLALTGLVGCATVDVPVKAPESAPVAGPPADQKVTLEVKASDPVTVCPDHKELAKELAKMVRESRTLPYEGPELSNNAFVMNGNGYISMWGGLSVFDARDFYNDLLVLRESYHVKEIHIYFNSGGGDAMQGMALADAIESAQDKNGNTPIIMHASGIVASAAVPILAVCNERYATPSTIFMVHKGSLFKLFAKEDEDDLKSQQEMIALTKRLYLQRLADNTNLTYDEWAAMEKQTTWFDTMRAYEIGLIHGTD